MSGSWKRTSVGNKVDYRCNKLSGKPIRFFLYNLISWSCNQELNTLHLCKQQNPNIAGRDATSSAWNSLAKSIRPPQIFLFPPKDTFNALRCSKNHSPLSAASVWAGISQNSSVLINCKKCQRLDKLQKVSKARIQLFPHFLNSLKM